MTGASRLQAIPLCEQPPEYLPLNCGHPDLLNLKAEGKTVTVIGVAHKVQSRLSAHPGAKQTLFLLQFLLVSVPAFLSPPPFMAAMVVAAGALAQPHCQGSVTLQS